MKVGFYHVEMGKKSPLPELMVRSVRKAMPDVEIVQFTADKAAKVPGVTELKIMPVERLAMAVLSAYRSVEGDWLFLDTDVIVQEDVRAVFADPFEIAVSERAGTLRDKENGSKFMAQMPYNKGAVFSRSDLFWEMAYDHCFDMEKGQQEWMGDQVAMCRVIARDVFKVKVLPNRFNYAPLQRTEDVSDKAILHFKGDRKSWMVGHAAKLGL